MQCYLDHAREEGLALPTLTITKDGLTTVQLAIIVSVMQGGSVPEIATHTGLTEGEVTTALNNPPLSTRLAEINRAVGRRIQDGDFGVAAIFKQEAPEAAKRLIGISKDNRDIRVQAMTNKDIITLAGFEPPKRLQIDSVNVVLRDMTVPELDHYALTGEWPDRFSDRLHAMRPDPKDVEKIAQEKQPPPTDDPPQDWVPLDEDTHEE